jgi:tRNA pseudouridine38-40 synthase
MSSNAQRETSDRVRGEGEGQRERTIRLLVEYDGSAYVGWQAQESGPSIQAKLAEAVLAVTSHAATLRVAGRTDAGVHALGQVVAFRTTSPIPGARFAAALNSYLPPDISVHRSDEAPDDFDPRFSALSKRYRYRIYQGRAPAALERTRAWYRRQPLDLEAMRAAAERLIGEHDFNAFRSVHCDASHARRAVFGIDITQTPRPPAGWTIDLEFHANAFCRHMVRILTGTLVEVGLGRRSPESVEAILAGRDRRQAGVTAPPHGLTLLGVEYPA